jgi:hypothetical protein
MNIYNLQYIFKHKHGYYIAGKNKPSSSWFISIDRERLELINLYEYEKFEDIPYGVLEKLDRLPIENNICLTDTFPPFQLGQKINSFSDFASLSEITRNIVETKNVKIEDIVIPFIGGIGLDFKKILLEMLEEKEKHCFHYVKIFENHVHNRIIEIQNQSQSNEEGE